MSKNKKITLAVMSALLVIVVIVCCVFAFKKGSDGNINGDKDNTTTSSSLNNDSNNSNETKNEGKNNLSKDEQTTKKVVSMPVSSVKVNLPALPTSVNQKANSTTPIIDATLKFNKISCVAYDKSDNQVVLKFKYTAEKTFDKISDNNRGPVNFKVQLVNDVTEEIVYDEVLTIDAKIVGDVCEDYGFEITCNRADSFTLKIL